MTNTVISTTTITAGTSLALTGAADTAVILPGVALVSTDEQAITVMAQSCFVSVLGTVSGLTTAIDMIGTGPTEPLAASVAIAAGGIVSAGIGDGIRFNGFATSIRNGGTIQAGRFGVSTGVLVASGHASQIENHGIISAGEAGIVALAENMRIANAGRIVALDYPGSGILAGSLDNLLGGILVDGQGGRVLNSGEVLTLSDNAYGIALAGDQGYVSNSGSVTATATAAGRAAVALVSAGGQLMRLVNTASGRIDAEGVAVLGLEGREEVRNAGSISGLVDLRGGADYLVNAGLIDGTVDLGGGADVLVNAGRVTLGIALGDGDDSYQGRSGSSVGVTVEGQAGDDSLTGGDLADVLEGGLDDDDLAGGLGEDTLFGGLGNDVVHGGGGDDLVFGEADNDSLFGDAGDDSVNGAAGNDRLDGGTGNDRLTGGAGRDIQDGGLGADLFVFLLAGDSVTGSSSDVIRDFRAGEDRIDLDGVNAGDLTFVGTGAFAGGGTASVRYTVSAAGAASLFVDNNGDGVAEMRIVIFNTPVLTAADLVL